ncbi:MAG: helix-turn-helix domain-containing protein [Clostridiales bacterium]
MSELFDSLVKSLNEAIEYEKGNNTNTKRRIVKIVPIPDFTSNEIKKIRETLNLSQASFAEFLGVTKKAVEAWEAGTNKPSTPTRRTLQIMLNDTSLLDKYIKSAV